MTNAQLAERVKALEEEVAQLKVHMATQAKEHLPWWEKIWGAFADDPSFAEAVELGRKYRQSLRPRSRSRAKKQAGKK